MILCAGCRQDMHDQPRYRPLSESAFFGDGRSARPPVEGTVARGQLYLDSARYTGKIDGDDVDTFPFPITRADLDRGHQRFDIYCSPCHGRTGQGNGMAVLRGFRAPTSFHADRLLTAPLGHYYDVITNGWGAMPRYAVQVSSDDRWRIAAYIRVLQLSENTRLQDLSANERREVEGAQ